MATANAAQPPASGGDPVHVPTLRQDLELLESWVASSGEPTWTIFDPLRNQYFRIGRTFFIFLSFWKLSLLDDIKDAAQERLKRHVDTDEIGEFVKFLLNNQLTDVSSKDGYRAYFERAEAGKRGIFATAIHSYLFFKIPLFRPQKFLDATWPYLRFLFSPTSVLGIVLAGILGLYLVSRQWDAFQDTFFSLISWEGAALYGGSLVFIKICHEFGHAYMAHRYGLKVSVIGMAFLVLMPILYTDTSNAWRLTSKRKRLMIDGGGVIVELGLACIATLLWVFIPDGGVRTAVFSVAAVSWTLSLVVNLNPFMRFDGYYILSDFLEVENLQARGFAFARWRLRELLFGLNHPPPETLEKNKRGLLVLHAWGTWIYRFFLFLGIALLVYTFFVKVVAIVLFAVEIMWFICLPIYREMKEWWQMRDQIYQSKRALFSLTALAVVLTFFFLPLSRTVSAVGILHAEQEVNVYAPYASQLIQLNVENAKQVKQGDVLAVFRSEELELKIKLISKRIALLQKRIDRSGQDELDSSNLIILKSELDGQKTELRDLRQQQERLTLTAQISGTVVDLPNSIHVDRYVDQSSQMFRLLSPNHHHFSGLVREMHLDRITKGARGVFYPDDIMLKKLDVELVKINNASSRTFSFPSMSSQFGGTVTSMPAKTRDDKMEVEGSYYGVEFRNRSTLSQPITQTQRGIVHIQASPKSLAMRAYEQVASILIRETGF